MADKVCLFPLGTLVSTPGALLALLEANVSAVSLLARHVSGDFGDLCDEDRAANDLASISTTWRCGCSRWPASAS